MQLKTTDIIYPKMTFTLTFVLGTEPFLVVGIDLTDRALIMILFNTRLHILTINILGKIYHL